MRPASDWTQNEDAVTTSGSAPEVFTAVEALHLVGDDSVEGQFEEGAARLERRRQRQDHLLVVRVEDGLGDDHVLAAIRADAHVAQFQVDRVQHDLVHRVHHLVPSPK